MKTAVFALTLTLISSVSFAGFNLAEYTCAEYRSATCHTESGYESEGSWPYSCRDKNGNFRYYCTETRAGKKFLFNLKTLNNGVVTGAKIETVEGSGTFYTGCETEKNPMVHGKTQKVTAEFLIIDKSKCNAQTEIYND